MNVICWPVPSNTLIRDLTAPDPPYGGRGPRSRKVALRACGPLVCVNARCRRRYGRPSSVGDGEKGPLAVQERNPPVGPGAEPRASRRRRRNSWWWFASGKRTASVEHDYLLSSAPLTTPLEEFARVFKAQHRIEECLKRAKGEAGLADYQVRTWEGWHHHQTLALMATWFLTQETRRGKNPDTRTHRSTSADDDCWTVEPATRLPAPGSHWPYRESRRLQRNEKARLYHWKRHNRLPPRRFEQRT